MNKYLLAAFVAAALLASCSSNSDKSDAYGNFETTEVIISAQGNGQIVKLNIEEGQELAKGDTLGIIDTKGLGLKREQILAAISAVRSKTKDVPSQINVLIEQKNNLLREKRRIERLLKDSAATKKQAEDIDGQIEVIEKNITASKKAMNDGNAGILSEVKPLEAQLRQIDDNIDKCFIIAPQSGVVLSKYAQEGEIAAFGKPILKLANISTMILRAYISGSQLASVKLGNKVNVLIDAGNDKMNTLYGKITWIASKAEFTPKIIQTKEERVNLVYAVKIEVVNDGSLKIGMPGEVKFVK